MPSFIDSLLLAAIVTAFCVWTERLRDTYAPFGDGGA